MHDGWVLFLVGGGGRYSYSDYTLVGKIASLGFLFLVLKDVFFLFSLFGSVDDCC